MPGPGRGVGAWWWDRPALVVPGASCGSRGHTGGATVGPASGGGRRGNRAVSRKMALLFCVLDTHEFVCYSQRLPQGQMNYRVHLAQSLKAEAENLRAFSKQFEDLRLAQELELANALDLNFDFLQLDALFVKHQAEMDQLVAKILRNQKSYELQF